MAQDFTFENGKAIPKYVAQIKDFRGKVYKEVKGVTTEVGHGERFYKNETIITGDRSMVKLALIDDSILNLSAQSTLAFSDYKFVDKSDRQFMFNFIKGQVRSLVKNKAKNGDSHIIKTPLAVMAVRGTELLINHRKIKDLEVSEFALLSGAAQVTNTQGVEQTLTKASRFTVAQDKVRNLAAQDLRQLSETEMLELLSLKQDEEKDFKPFLSFLDPEPLLKPQTQAALPSTTTAHGEVVEKDQSKKNWKENLDKLNQELRKNRGR